MCAQQDYCIKIFKQKISIMALGKLKPGIGIGINSRRGGGGLKEFVDSMAFWSGNWDFTSNQLADKSNNGNTASCYNAYGFYGINRILRGDKTRACEKILNGGNYTVYHKMIKKSTATGVLSIINNHAAGATTKGFNIYSWSGNLWFDFADGTNRVSKSYAAKWTGYSLEDEIEVYFRIDSINKKIYTWCTGEVAEFQIDASSLSFNSDANNEDFIIGSSSNLSIKTKILSGNVSLANCRISEDNLLAYYAYCENAGDNSYDLSANGNHLTGSTGLQSENRVLHNSEYILNKVGSTRVVKSDLSEKVYIPYTVTGIANYNHSSPIWDADETYTEHLQDGKTLIPGTLIKLSENVSMIASGNNVTVNDWYDGSDNANAIEVENIINYEKALQYFNTNSFIDLILIKDGETISDDTDSFLLKNVSLKKITNYANIIIITGQSNAVGQPRDDLSRYDIDPNLFIWTDGNYLAYPETGHFEIANVNENTVHRDYTDPENQYNAIVGYSAEAKCARLLTEYTGEPTFIIKVAYGGNGVSYWVKNMGATRWNELADYVPSALSWISSLGFTPRILSTIWLQGESDCGELVYPNYSTRFNKFLSDYRNEITDTRFVMCTIRTDADWNADGIAAINTVFSTAESELENCVVINTNTIDAELYTLLQHYTGDGYDTIGGAWFDDIINNVL
jgi:hypothetical protein